jgi:hypothetical protein
MGTKDSISVAQFIVAIDKLNADEPYERRGGWYGTTKDQWLGWLKEYDTPGYYGRKGSGYDARFAYTHMQNHQMLIWLLAAAGLEAPTLTKAATAAEAAKTMAAKAAAVRRIVPWDRAVELLWPDRI